jgi:hypothetical protein
MVFVRLAANAGIVPLLGYDFFLTDADSVIK